MAKPQPEALPVALPAAEGAALGPSPRDRLSDKRLHGQFFTTTNPFVNKPFEKWIRSLPKGAVLLEPFAGSNNIVRMLRDLGYGNEWKSFDIAPVCGEQNSAPDVAVVPRDTLADFPKGFDVAITNPPYLAKNSASRMGLEYAGGAYDDVYQKALQVMLENLGYVAAIVPESFITQGLFHDRLDCVVSLAFRMFEDTETPVCLALFVPLGSKKTRDFDIWNGNRFVGSFSDLSKLQLAPQKTFGWKFNDPSGPVGLHCVDGAKKGRIRFSIGSDIPGEAVKASSRSITRISLPGLDEKEAALVVQIANKRLDEHRKETQDVFLTAFKGLREDGRYRRRLDFTKAREFLDHGYAEHLEKPAQKNGEK